MSNGFQFGSDAILVLKHLSQHRRCGQVDLSAAIHLAFHELELLIWPSVWPWTKARRSSPERRHNHS